MIKRSGRIKSLTTAKDIAMLDKEIQILYDAGNYSSGGGTISVWTSTTRPANPQLGTFGFNLTLNSIEVYGSSGWYVFGGTNPTATVWTTVTRPSPPAPGQMGFNTDFSGQEVYTAGGWRILNGIWTTGTRPSPVAVGSQGWNTTIPAREYYDDTGTWNQS